MIGSCFCRNENALRNWKCNVLTWQHTVASLSLEAFIRSIVVFLSLARNLLKTLINVVMKRNKNKMELDGCLFRALHLQTKRWGSRRNWSSTMLQVVISDASSRLLKSKMLFDWCTGLVESFRTLKMHENRMPKFCKLISSCMPITLAKVNMKRSFAVKARAWCAV